MRWFGPLLALLLGVLPVSTWAQTAPSVDDRFGVILAGLSDDGLPAESRAADVLGVLGLHWWYAFSPGSATVPGTHRVQMARPSDAPIDLAARARGVPGSAWILGNEPNVPGQDDILPEVFAAWYHDATYAIRAVDPLARFVGPNGLNWDFTCTGCGGYTSTHDWSDLFLEAYRAAYGEPPLLDAWGLHVYDVDWANPPLVHTERSLAQIEGARVWLDEQPDLAGKPIWVTELGVIFGYDSYSVAQVGSATVVAPRGPWRQDAVEGFVADMVGWLTTRGAELGVERWFLYSALPAREPYQAGPAGVALLRGPADALAPTPEGQLYLQTAALPPAAEPGEPSEAPAMDGD